EGDRERRHPLSRRRTDHHLGRLRLPRLIARRPCICGRRGLTYRGDLSKVSTTAGETGPWPGAEGATAPETLRQKDRSHTSLWKAGCRPVSGRTAPPKEQPGGAREISQVSGQG